MTKHFLEATAIRVVRQRENGSGIIEIPIMATATGSDIELTVAMMQQLVDNFESFSLVPIGVSPHQDFDQRGGFSPGFIDSIELRGDLLYGQIDLIAPLFAEVVELGGWRGFSVEINNGLKTQAKDIEGWVLTGGVFTNRPAVDAHFRIAAEGRTGSYATHIVPPPKAAREVDMAEDNHAPAAKSVTLEYHEQKLQIERDSAKAASAQFETLQGRIEAVTSELKQVRLEAEESKREATDYRNDKLAAEARSNRLESEAKGLRDANEVIKREKDEFEAKYAEQLTSNLSIKVKEIIDAAIGDKVPPAMFEGFESNPAEWMSSRYASLDSFEAQVAAMRGSGLKVVEGAPVNSGHTAKKSDTLLEGLSDREADVLKKHTKLGVDFTSARNADEARAMLEAAKAESKN